MGQSNYIAAAIAIAFLVYITAKGSLPNYISIMTASTGFSSDQSNSSVSNSGNSNSTSAFDGSGSSGGGSGGGGGGGDQTTTTTPTNSSGSTIKSGFDASTILDGVNMFGGGW